MKEALLIAMLIIFVIGALIDDWPKRTPTSYQCLLLLQGTEVVGQTEMEDMEMKRIVLLVLIYLFVILINSGVDLIFGTETSGEFILLIVIFIYLDIVKETKGKWK